MKKSVPLPVSIALTIVAVALTWAFLPAWPSAVAGKQATAEGAPALVSYQGYVTDGSGEPHEGNADVRVRLYDSETSPTALWEELHDNAPTTDGYFTLLLGSVTPLSAGAFDGTERWLQVSVDTGDGYADFPRSRVASVPYALQAARVPWSGVSGVDYSSDVQARVTGACVSGFYVRAVNTDGTVVCEEVEGVPAGTIVMWSGSLASIPDGWVLCDGTNATPDLRDRFIVGAGNAYALDDTGGEATHTLTIAEMPSHNHGGSTATDGAHSHTVRTREQAAGSLVAPQAHGTSTGAFHDYGGFALSPGSAHSHAIQAQGGGTAHENRPPYYALAFIMKQ
jgi:microcystin-dependent protein